MLSSAVILVVYLSGGDTYYERPLPHIVADSVFMDAGKVLSPPTAARMDSFFSLQAERGRFNGTVVYAVWGRPVYEAAFGFSDISNKELLDVHSSFQLASVSKMFTAMAIMILVEEGTLGVDDSITKYIPGFPYEGVTIRHLLTHRSGLPRYMPLAEKKWTGNGFMTNSEMIRLLRTYRPRPYFKPDQEFHYCNTNYALLASIVEAVSKVSFDRFVAYRIFRPLGMNDSFVYNPENDTNPTPANGYTVRGRRVRRVGDHFLNGVMGDKGVYSSTPDLFKFNAALDEGTLISWEGLQQVFTPGSPTYAKRKNNYGFGWRIREDMDSTTYHFGWWKGFRSYFIRDMRHHRCLIVLTNTDQGVSSEQLWGLMDQENWNEELLAGYRKLFETNYLPRTISRNAPD